MTEDQLLAAVLELATMYNWLSFHVTNSTRLIRKGMGYIRIKNISTQGTGYPDLTLVGDRILYRELKQDGRYPTPEQRNWGERITAAGGDFAIWRPKDLRSGLILAELRPRPAAPAQER